MKKPTIALTLYLMLAASTYAQPEASISRFDIPPFEEEATVDRIDGWKMVSTTKTDKAIVRIHGGDAPGLLLQTYGIEKRLDEELGGEVTITMDMDLSMRTFLMTVAGTGMNGEPFEVKSEEIAMDPPDRFPPNELPLRGIRLAAGLPASTELYVESITIAPKAY